MLNSFVRWPWSFTLLLNLCIVRLDLWNCIEEASNPSTQRMIILINKKKLKWVYVYEHFMSEACCLHCSLHTRKGKYQRHRLEYFENLTIPVAFSCGSFSIIAVHSLTSCMNSSATPGWVCNKVQHKWKLQKTTTSYKECIICLHVSKVTAKPLYETSKK